MCCKPARLLSDVGCSQANSNTRGLLRRDMVSTAGGRGRAYSDSVLTAPAVGMTMRSAEHFYCLLSKP